MSENNTLRYRMKKRSGELEPIEIDGLGQVHIRRLTTGQMLELSKLPEDQSGLAMVAQCVRESDGAPVFDAPDDAREVEWGVMQSILAACQKVNNLQAKVEDAAKN